MDRFDVEIKKEVNDFLEKNIRFTTKEGEMIRKKLNRKKKRRLGFTPVYWTVLLTATTLFIFFSISIIGGLKEGTSSGNSVITEFFNIENKDKGLYEGEELTIGVLGAVPEINEKQVSFQKIMFEQFTIKEVRKFDAIFVMKESLSAAAEKQYTPIFTESNIPFFFINSNKGAYPFIDENLEYEKAREIPNHNYYATGYLLTSEGEEMTWTYEPSKEDNKNALSNIFTTIEKVAPKTFKTEL